MTANLETRLARLEHRGRAAGWRPPFKAATGLLGFLLAAHLGNLELGEPVEEGEARALGYADRREMRVAMLADGSFVFGWSRRHGEACERLLAMRDTSLSSGLDRVAAALTGLVADLPEAIRGHACTGTRDAIDEAAEWLCL